jgi:hypothetical protein
MFEQAIRIQNNDFRFLTDVDNSEDIKIKCEVYKYTAYHIIFLTEYFRI